MTAAAGGARHEKGEQGHAHRKLYWKSAHTAQ
jgi:hypothetical protein